MLAGVRKKKKFGIGGLASAAPVPGFGQFSG
jgi:hypothetical protein